MTGTMADKFERISNAEKRTASDLDSITPDGNDAVQILYRTTIDARKMLKQVALDERTTVQNLLTEAINMLLISRGRDHL